MSRYEVFANRNKEYKYDVLEYEYLSPKLRNQIQYIFQDALRINNAGASDGERFDGHFVYIRNFLCRELGISALYHSRYGEYMTASEECEGCLMDSEDTELVLSLIELCIRSIEELRNDLSPIYKYRYEEVGLFLDMNEAIEELNLRFRRAGLGYEFLNGFLIRKDSEYIHEEVTKPALHLLQEEGFEGALAEFLEAHDHFRKKENKSCINSASNAFESVMKTMCIKFGWEVKGSGTSSQLIQALVENGLVPNYLDSYMASLRSLSTVRNKKTGHGQGEVSLPPVPDFFVNYALHLCATNIVFLIEAYREYKKTQ